MRKLHISLALSLLLLLAQQGAMLHELSHLARAGSTAAGLQADSSFDKACELCLAFSQLGHTAGATGHAVHFEPSAHAVRAIPRSAATPADVPTARSRGPPLAS